MVAVYEYGWTDRQDFVDECPDRPLYYILSEDDFARAMCEHPDWISKKDRIRRSAHLLIEGKTP